MADIVTSLRRLKNGCMHALSARLTRGTKPHTSCLLLATLTDLGRPKSELIAEIALLRHQLTILQRQVKRPTFTRTDRVLLVLLARLVRTWQQALIIVQPDTLLRWHRELFRLVWKRKSKAFSNKPRIAAETIALIRQMAKDNRLWGAERIRGELLKLGLHVCKRTIQKYMRGVCTQQPRGQKWSTFLRNHADQIWCTDYLGHPFKKQALRDGERSVFPACKYRKVGVESDVVDSILMLERHYSCAASAHTQPTGYATRYEQANREMRIKFL